MMAGNSLIDQEEWNACICAREGANEVVSLGKQHPVGDHIQRDLGPARRNALVPVSCMSCSSKHRQIELHSSHACSAHRCQIELLFDDDVQLQSLMA